MRGSKRNYGDCMNKSHAQLVKLCNKWDSHTLLVGMEIGTNTLGNCLTVSNKVKDAGML